MTSAGPATVNLLAGKKSSGEPVYEEVPVEPVPGSVRVRVLATPGMVLDIAAGDVIEVDGTNGSFTTFSRGGNIGVHVYGPHAAVDEFVSGIEAVGGRLDGRARGVTAFTVPYGEGFRSLEAVLNEMVAAHPDVEWYYSNVYAEDGDTPLNWWL